MLAVAPFLSEVEVLTDCSKNKDADYSERPFSKWQDTVGILYFYQIFNDSVVAMPHSGFWLECVFQGKKGFMFGGFLEKIEPRHTYPENCNELNNQFRLRKIDGNECGSNNPEFSKDWKWSGLFKKGDKFEVRPVSPSYAYRDARDSMGGFNDGYNCCETFFRTADKVPPVYIFGTKKAWPTHILEGIKMGLFAGDRTNIRPDFNTPEMIEAVRKAGFEAAEDSIGNYKYFRWAQKTDDGTLKSMFKNIGAKN